AALAEICTRFPELAALLEQHKHQGEA
ncbi:MAG: hypothetical protein ACJARR_003019, partial [Pseudophaeobacter arcticus]